MDLTSVRGVRATLTFTDPANVVPDDERPGLLRDVSVTADDAGDTRVCEATDLSDPATTEPGLDAAGFETIDLTTNAALQAALDEVDRRGALTDDTAAEIRAGLTGMEVTLTDGTRLRIELVTDDGLFHRRSGPAWADANPGGIDGANGHGGAKRVHGDQDVYGTPLRQLMHGAAPDTFRHVTPDGRNDDATTYLLNLWIPLHAPVQPLTLMDRRTVDAEHHQLRYGLPVDGFLERDADAAINDLWHFLFHEDQRWYLRTDMDARHGYLFHTLGTAHGAASLPGEDALAPLFVALTEAVGACATGEVDPATIGVSTPEPPADATDAIRAGWHRLTAQLDRAATLLADAAPAEQWEAWRTDAVDALESVTRRSIELRLVATVVDTAALAAE